MLFASPSLSTIGGARRDLKQRRGRAPLAREPAGSSTTRRARPIRHLEKRDGAGVGWLTHP